MRLILFWCILSTIVVIATSLRLYVYDHCPFCVRVRLAFGLKGIKHDLRFLLNDDVDTPTKLVGKKVVPILEIPNKLAMPESFDIIKMIDQDTTYPNPNMFKPLSSRSDLNDWQNRVGDINRKLQRPRYMKVLLPEFSTQDARDTYVKNHPLPGFTSDQWKETLSNNERWTRYNACLDESTSLIKQINEALLELNEMIYCKEYCTVGGVSLDDIDLFARLRSLTIVKGINLPPKVSEYMCYMSEKGDILLYDSLAC